MSNNASITLINPEGFEHSKLVSIDSYSDGSYIACGTALESGVQDTFDQAGFWVVKLSASYEKEWEYLLDSGSALKVIATSDGQAFAAGYNDAGFYAIHLSSTGSSNWAYTDSSTVSNVGVAETPGNELILAYDSFVRLDASGNVLANVPVTGGAYGDAHNGKDEEIAALLINEGAFDSEYFSVFLDTNGNVLNGQTEINEEYGTEYWYSVASLETGISAFCGQDLSGMIKAYKNDNTEYWTLSLDFSYSDENYEMRAHTAKDIIVNSEDNFMAVGQVKYKSYLCLYEVDTLGSIQQVIPLNGILVRTEDNYALCQNNDGTYVIAASSDDAQGLLIEVK